MKANKMIRLLGIFLLLLFCITCKIGEKKETVDELLIFGYSGFCFRDSFNHVYPSYEDQINDSVKLEYDSTRLDIRQYFEFKKDSIVHCAIKSPSQETEYLSIDQSDTIGLENLINSELINKKYNINYSFPDTTPMIYDGLQYTLYYKTSKGNTFVLNYIPKYLPGSLDALHDFMQNLIYKRNPKRTIKFEYNPITTIEAKRLFKKYPPLSIRLNKNIKFIPPVIIDD